MCGWGASLLLLPDSGAGRLLISCRKSGGVQHSAIPLHLQGGKYEEKKEIDIELCRFSDSCVLIGAEPSGAEARKIVSDFAIF